MPEGIRVTQSTRAVKMGVRNVVSNTYCCLLVATIEKRYRGHNLADWSHQNDTAVINAERPRCVCYYTAHIPSKVRQRTCEVLAVQRPAEKAMLFVPR